MIAAALTGAPPFVAFRAAHRAPGHKRTRWRLWARVVGFGRPSDESAAFAAFPWPLFVEVRALLLLSCCCLAAVVLLLSCCCCRAAAVVCYRRPPLACRVACALLLLTLL